MNQSNLQSPVWQLLSLSTLNAWSGYENCYSVPIKSTTLCYALISRIYPLDGLKVTWQDFCQWR